MYSLVCFVLIRENKETWDGYNIIFKWSKVLEFVFTTIFIYTGELMVAVFQQLWVHWSMSWDIVWIWATLRMESWRGDLMTWTDSFPFVQTLLPHSVQFYIY